MPKPDSSISISTKFLFDPTKIPNIGTKCEWSALCPGEISVAPTGQKIEWTLDQSTFNTKQEKCLILPHIKLPFTCAPACSVSHYNVLSPPDSVPQGLVSHLTLQQLHISSALCNPRIKNYFSSSKFIPNFITDS